MVDIMQVIVALGPQLKIVGFFMLFMLILGIGMYYVLVIARRRKWKVEIHEQKADGKLHTVGYDILVERKMKGGRRVIYWLKKAKQETIPPPDDCVDRIKNKEEVDYLRVERDIIPMTKTCEPKIMSNSGQISTNYNNPIVRSKLTIMFDRILKGIKNTKNTKQEPRAVQNKYMHIPIEKTLTAKMTFRPIPYDMNMMAINEIHTADEFFQGKYEFWKKYGAIIVFGLTIVFLIVLIVLTFDYVQTVIATVMGKVDPVTNKLASIVESIGDTRGIPPVS